MDKDGLPKEREQTDKPPEEVQGASPGDNFLTLLVIVGILLICAVAIFPNFIQIGPGSRSPCSYAEEDARNVLAWLAAYYSEPENMRIPSIATLQSQGLSLHNDSPEPTIWPPVGSNTPSSQIQVTVYDNSNRCPRGSAYTATMGEGEVKWE